MIVHSGIVDDHSNIIVFIDDFVILPDKFMWWITWENSAGSYSLEEVNNWCKDNLKNEYLIDELFFIKALMIDIFFTSDEDMMLFKLRWS